MLTSLKVAELGGQEVAIQAAKNFRALRKLGVTVRKTIDSLIATRCIESGYDLLHDDRDFDPFAKHLGLAWWGDGSRAWSCQTISSHDLYTSQPEAHRAAIPGNNSEMPRRLD